MTHVSDFLFLAGWTVLTVLAVRRWPQANRERRVPKPSKWEDRLHGLLLVGSAVLTAAGWAWLIGGLQ